MIGVLVPAHNEAEHLAACLRSLAVAAAHPGLAGEAVQVIVALDACTDGSSDVCSRSGAETVDLQARCVGAARSAAAGLLIERGASWLASTDADSTVPADWLVAQRSAGADVFCGVVDLGEVPPPQVWLRSCFRQGERWGEGHGRVHGANMGVSTAAYLRAGGFSALRCSEDVDLLHRLHADGASICWAGAPVVTTSARMVGRAAGGFADHLAALAGMKGSTRPRLAMAS
ncbi:glycosyl transferase [Stenotrophomonas sp. ESTM1D_MKCIP4_1]|uniref:glycosyltransferase n=1 Tax=Stenotrophomonas sp. ESTM1D_MKCIP4_1 TaxID=2072414 RepID=UPI000D541B31|nr:glycosyltransferase family 2 protein [Stenotrophomonas sp. ESTM1D_MKCIP4_1]AWH53559.1 glycosyl transferase [Stenotrophomonas sp. ESTM1D_MKCIP4_1]